MVKKKYVFFTIFRYWNCSSSCEKSKLIGNNSWNCGVWMKSQGNAKYEKRIYYAAFSKIRNMQSFSQQKAFFSYFRKNTLNFFVFFNYRFRSFLCDPIRHFFGRTRRTLKKATCSLKFKRNSTTKKSGNPDFEMPKSKSCGHINFSMFQPVSFCTLCIL